MTTRLQTQDLYFFDTPERKRTVSVNDETGEGRMNHHEQKTVGQPGTQTAMVYEPPCIETVLMPEALEREVLYAGNENGLMSPVL